MPILKNSELRAIARSHTDVINKAILTEAFSKTTSFDIFLSHSFLDKEVIEGLYYLLTEIGLKVYVDWIVDPSLDRANVTKETVKIIQARMRSSKSLLVAISDNVFSSKWIPWELGFMDGTTQKCAIVPVSANNIETSYQGKEFFSIYPHVTKWESDMGIDKLWVLEERKKFIVLDEWIKLNRAPFLREQVIY